MGATVGSVLATAVLLPVLAVLRIISYTIAQRRSQYRLPRTRSVYILAALVFSQLPMRSAAECTVSSFADATAIGLGTLATSQFNDTSGISINKVMNATYVTDTSCGIIQCVDLINSSVLTAVEKGGAGRLVCGDALTSQFKSSVAPIIGLNVSPLIFDDHLIRSVALNTSISSFYSTTGGCTGNANFNACCYVSLTDTCILSDPPTKCAAPLQSYMIDVNVTSVMMLTPLLSIPCVFMNKTSARFPSLFSLCVTPPPPPPVPHLLLVTLL